MINLVQSSINIFIFRWFGEAVLASFSFIGHKDSYFEDKVKLPVCSSLTLWSFIVGTHTLGPTGRLWLVHMKKAESIPDSWSGISFFRQTAALTDKRLTTKNDPRPAAEPEVEHWQWHTFWSKNTLITQEFYEIIMIIKRCYHSNKYVF